MHRKKRSEVGGVTSASSTSFRHCASTTWPSQVQAGTGPGLHQGRRTQGFRPDATFESEEAVEEAIAGLRQILSS